MQEQTKIKIGNAILSNQITQSDIFKLLSDNIKIVEDLLVSYHFRNRGRVFDVRLNEGSIELISFNMAKFTVNYAIGQFNACADVDYSERAAMEMLIDIDAVKQEAIITGEYIPEREPDEF